VTTTRRDFTKLVGASAVAATAAATVASPAAALTIWEQAELEVQQTGEVSPQIVKTLLDLHGPHGIFDQPEYFEELRASLARKIRDHAVIRKYASELPADLEPLLSFRR
jgi:hypothetical protein